MKTVRMITKRISTPKRSLVLVLLQFPLCLQLVGVCTDHWIEGRENWFVKDEHNHIQVTWMVIDSTQGLKRLCCRSEECYGQCRPINFTDLSNGETKEMMSTWERYLFYARESSVFLKFAVVCTTLTTVIKILCPRNYILHSLTLTISAMFGFFGLTAFLAVTEKYRAAEYEFGVSFYAVMLGVLLEGLLALVLLEDRESVEPYALSEYSVITSRLTTIPNSSLESQSSSDSTASKEELHLSSTECLLYDAEPRIFWKKRSIKRMTPIPELPSPTSQGESLISL